MPEMAVTWFSIASDQGYGPAQNQMGEYYEEGVSYTIARDYQTALELYRLAAK